MRPADGYSAVNVAGIDSPIELLAVFLVVAGPIAGAWLTGYLANRKHIGKMASEVKAVRGQVENSHETNLRDDLTDVLNGINLIAQRQEHQGREIGGLIKDVGGLMDRVGDLAGDIRDHRDELDTIGKRIDKLKR
ncbi:Uncharacterised protein [Mycobacteroides abscessus subsp. abscessus]|nr:Uncharacterised protein [Mycobacteroides abscessus subsp. abscessus]SLJ23603.1 Uncharacterised protein [Mycobacteroides abscessus subsp. abscessus]SLJ50512.1 Uncharacterised protein [Mycobacteroides abscessus subsp. abscessus]SLK55569.1 Uncharacterised protein [Mycobacteroides abscessus subsp. abscessus]